MEFHAWIARLTLGTMRIVAAAKTANMGKTSAPMRSVAIVKTAKATSMATAEVSNATRGTCERTE
jgi:hypothetical protein